MCVIMSNLVNSLNFTKVKAFLAEAETLDVVLYHNPAMLTMRPFTRPDFSSTVHWHDVFMFDYKIMKDQRKDLHRDLMEHLYHPKRIEAWLDNENEIESYLN